METLIPFVPVFTAIIAIIGVLSFLLIGMNTVIDAKLKPLEHKLFALEAGQKSLSDKLDKILSKG